MWGGRGVYTPGVPLDLPMFPDFLSVLLLSNLYLTLN